MLCIGSLPTHYFTAWKNGMLNTLINRARMNQQMLVFYDANRLDMKNQLDKSKWLNSEIPETESVQTQTEETSHCVFLPYNQSTTDKGSDLEETSYQAWHCLCD